MQSQLKQQLRQLSNARASGAATNPAADRKAKLKATRINKPGAELKCGCGPWNDLPALLAHPRSTL